MAKSQTRTPRAAKPAAPLAQAAAALVAQPAPAAAPAAPKTIALRGGQAVASVKLSGNPYRTGAPHNQQWWATLTKELSAGPKPVAELLLNDNNKGGVPAAFIGYTLRRGYLSAV